MRQKKLMLAVLAALATTGLMVTATQAQTSGMGVVTTGATLARKVGRKRRSARRGTRSPVPSVGRTSATPSRRDAGTTSRRNRKRPSRRKPDPSRRADRRLLMPRPVIMGAAFANEPGQDSEYRGRQPESLKLREPRV